MDRERKSVQPKLITPYCPEETGDKAYGYENCSSDIKIVSDYTGLNFLQVWDLELFEYWGYLHDTIIWNCEKTESGIEYLKSAYNHSQTEPDREKLRSRMR